MAKKADPTQIIQRWLERDLSAAAAAGQLPPAFEMDEALEQLCEIVSAGRRPVVTGEPGVGKTALVYELTRRIHAGEVLPFLRGRRILQLSFRQRAAGLRKPERVAEDFQRLVESLLPLADEVIPFFRDFHLAYKFDLESPLLTLAFRFPGVILSEGEAAALDSLFEYTPELNEHFVLFQLEEPKVERVGRILQGWGDDRATRRGRQFTPEALERVLQLTHRFLVRTKQPRSAIDFVTQVEGLHTDAGCITGSDVIERFCRAHRTPRVLLDPAAPLDLAALEAQFNRRVLGQPEAIRSVVNMVGVIKAGLSDTRRPFGVYLFVGPTGVGKTHVAQLLAEYLFGGRERMIRFNMADYPNEDNAKIIFGDPDGNRLQSVGLLTRRLMGHPFAVLLLDEFEKAHAKTHDRFFQLMDEGSFINGAGECVSCRATIVIATSNAGAEAHRGESFGFRRPADRRAANRELDRRLEQHFRFELLNRFDQIVHFHPLSREDIRTIARGELELLQERAGLAQRSLSLEIDEAVLDWLAAHGYDPDYGARFLRRTIEREITTVVADAVVRDNPPSGGRLMLAIRANRVVARVASAPERTPAGKETVTLPLGTRWKARVLDRLSLAEEAKRLGAAAADRLDTLETRRREYNQLLESMNEPGFWDDGPARGPALDRFRELDVAIQVEERLAQPIHRLLALSGRQGAEVSDLGPLARAVECAAEALSEWEERAATEGPSAVWLAISNVDPLRRASQWISELVSLEIAWCRRLHLSVAVAAYALEDDELTRVVLDVDGPGAAAYLAMEHGVHRRFKSQAQDSRARIEVVPKGAAPTAPWPDLLTLKRRQGLFGLEINCRGRLELVDRGLSVDFLGEYGMNVSHLLQDLTEAWSVTALASLEPARLYGEDGVGARDPRTGTTIIRMKDALSGNLDKLLEAWRQRRCRPESDRREMSTTELVDPGQPTPKGSGP